MSDKNYIEIVHEYVETEENGDWEKSRDVYWAVKPTPEAYGWGHKDDNPDDLQYPDRGYTGWDIQGKLGVYGIEDIRGLRKLLDALEQEFS